MIGNLFPEIYKKNTIVTCLFIGWIYALIGLIAARILFPTDPSIAALAFTSMMILSDEIFFKMLFETKHKRIKDVFLPYASMFFGVMLVYIVASIALPSIQANDIFKSQIAMKEESPNVAGNDLFTVIVFNNAIVMLIIFAFSILMRGGGVFFLVWNASVWGTVFGLSTKMVAATTTNPIPLLASTGFLMFILIFSSPFVMAEVLAYVNAAIAGNKINEFTRGKAWLPERVFTGALALIAISLLFIVLGAYVEASIVNNINPFSYFR